MPQWRKLWTKTTESLDLNDMPDDFHRLLWLMLPLITCSEGRGMDMASWIRSKAMPLRGDISEQMVEDAMSWYANHGMIVRYTVEGRNYFAIENWHKYQGDTSREADSDYPSPEQAEVVSRSRASHESVSTSVRSDADAEEKQSGGEKPMPPDCLKDLFDIPVAQIKGHKWTRKQYQEMLEAEQSRGDNARVTLIRWLKSKLGNSHHQAVQVYRKHAHLYPPDAWQEKLVEQVGDSEKALEFWEKVVVAWLGVGWKPTNVKGMLEHFERHEIPSTNGGRDAAPSRKMQTVRARGES